ncbi:MAG: hypothetical protein ACK2T7_08855 [Anaerolineales bacterium]
MKQKLGILLAAVVLLALLLTACAPTEPPVAPPADDTTAQNSAAPADAGDQSNQPAEAADGGEQPAGEPAGEPADEPPANDFTPLPPERQPIEITSAGDRMLEGWYYPAKVDNAPVVVLMHWAIGTMEDWQVIALWLQNRLDEVSVPQPGPEAYYDISWFPPMPQDVSYAVVVFNFGNFGNSPFGGDRESWVWDAIAALKFASTIEGVDPNRISAMGASIGADGPVDGCYLFNDANDDAACIGTLSLSPGNYLTENFSYPEAVAQLDGRGYPAWCLASEGDYESPALCEVLAGDHTRSFIFSGADHGMDLITPDHFPMEPALPDINTMMIIQEWLEVTYGVPLNDYSIP